MPGMRPRLLPERTKEELLQGCLPAPRSHSGKPRPAIAPLARRASISRTAILLHQLRPRPLPAGHGIDMPGVRRAVTAAEVGTDALEASFAVAKDGRKTEDNGCRQCPSGSTRRRPKERLRQMQCGQFSPGVGEFTNTCLACSPGQYQEETAQATCIMCSAGKVGDASRQDKVHKESLHCINCPEGQFQQSDGQIACADCAAGTFTGTSQCNSDNSDCTFQAGDGHAVCKACPVVDINRKWSSSPGATACFKVPMDIKLGEWSSWNASSIANEGGMLDRLSAGGWLGRRHLCEAYSAGPPDAYPRRRRHYAVRPR